MMIRKGTEKDLPGILEIYNDAILNTTAVYTYAPFSMDYATHWYQEKVHAGWPLLVDVENCRIAGFATYGAFRDWPAYKYTIEHSIYVHPDFRKKGIASQLMKSLLTIANESGYATVVAGIDGSNAASLLLHQKLGFRKVGEISNVGYKFQRWLTLDFYQLDLQGPKNPTEG